jgi:hypothetical protein
LVQLGISVAEIEEACRVGALMVDDILIEREGFGILAGGESGIGILPSAGAEGRQSHGQEEQG